MSIRLFDPLDCEPWNDSKFAVACSGGYDSMSIADFFVRGRRKPILLHVNHGTGNDKATDVVADYAYQHGLKCIIRYIDNRNKHKKESWEEYWRNERLKFFHEQYFPVITGHNLNDAMETWLFSSMHGQSKLIPYQHKNIFRPCLLTAKSDMLAYAMKHKLVWSEDHSNEDLKYARNRIRHNILPEVLHINKGFQKTIIKQYRKLYEHCKENS